MTLTRYPLWPELIIAGRRHGAADARRVPARHRRRRRARSAGSPILALIAAAAVVVEAAGGRGSDVRRRLRRRRLRPLHEAAGARRLGASRCCSAFDDFRDHKHMKFEYPVLMLLATAGMMMMISAGDLISLYLGLELQSLALYVVAAFRRDERALERGRPQVLRARRAVVRHAALRRLADLRLHRLDQLRR